MLNLGFVRPPTRGEFKVLLFTAAVVCFILGIVGIVAAERAPPEKQLLADQAMFYGVASLLFGVAFGLCLWLLCRFSDRS
ncbi:MAG TPA: hypothetical protein VJS88_04030 [Chthoniobacterales bacterium]|nr:hypothetical protein [Chthoniobacterales bacterium]